MTVNVVDDGGDDDDDDDDDESGEEGRTALSIFNASISNPSDAKAHELERSNDTA